MRAFTLVVVAAAFLGGPAAAEKPAPFVVLELYTSEGCSSCPAADRLLSEIAAEAGRGGDVVALAFHVDSWDYLGWRDRFGQSAFTSRLRSYKALSDGRIFTPELIVDGRLALVGSDERRVREAIQDALGEPRTARLLLTAERGEKPGTVIVRVRAGGVRADVVVNVAVVEDGLVTVVKRGENADRTLRHDRVVRAFASTTLARVPDTGVRLALPPDLVRGRSEIVAWVSDGPCGRALAAARAALP